jgi:hypothetical protein
VVDADYGLVNAADAFLRNLRFGADRTESKTKLYAGLYNSLSEGRELKIPEAIAARARVPIERMVATGGRARRGAYRIRTGVPIGMRCASRLIGRLATRMQPWDGQPGIRYGWFVPWMPTTPPSGQSLRLE